jgi:hypothetical protein
MPAEEFLRVCDEERITGLVHECVRRLPAGCEWPRAVRDAIAADVRARAANEMLLTGELIAVLDALAEDGIDAILLKGTALAYSLYTTPTARPRYDNDLLLRHDQIDRFRRTMTRLGYRSPLHCDGELLFCQFPLEKHGRFGIVHRFDCHWKISTQPVFADVLTFDDAASRAIAVPSLGARARTLAHADALLLACIHPTMHHRNVESLPWAYDVHLLASCLSGDEFVSFASDAVAKQVAAICAQQLTSVSSLLGTRIPGRVLAVLGAARNEPSAAYLEPDRQWIDELRSSVRALPHWLDRVKLLREVAFPKAAYMFAAYGVADSRLRAPLLPALYVHRLARGGWKVMARQK